MKCNYQSNDTDDKVYVPLDKIADIFRKKGIRSPKQMWHKILELIKTWSEYENEFIYSFQPSDFENLIAADNIKTPLEIRLHIRQLLVDYPTLKKRNDYLNGTLESLRMSCPTLERQDDANKNPIENHSRLSSETEGGTAEQIAMTAEVAFSLKKEYRGNARYTSRYRRKAPSVFCDNENLIFSMKPLKSYFETKGTYSKEQMLAVILILIQEYGYAAPSEAYTFGSRELKELFAFFGCKSHAEERQAIIKAVQDSPKLLEENKELEVQIKTLRNESEKTKTKKKELGEIAIGKTALRGIVDIPGIESTSIPLVQKSHTLLNALFHSEFTLLQFKLIDCYLRRINMHQHRNREVIFEKTELESLLGGKRIKTEEVVKALSDFKEKTVTVVKNRESGEIDEIPLFCRAEIGYFSGRLLIDLECSEEAIPYVFFVEDSGYVKYPLASSLSIQNLHTYVMYMYLLTNRFRGHWTENVIALRAILGCETSYQQFFLFNEKVLKVAYSNISENGNLRYTYREIKKIDQIYIAFPIINDEDVSAQLPDNSGKSSVNEAQNDIKKRNFEKSQKVCSYGEDIPQAEFLTPDFPY